MTKTEQLPYILPRSLLDDSLEMRSVELSIFCLNSCENFIRWPPLSVELF